MGMVHVVTASAGTGKTHRLVDEAVAALDGGTAPDRLMAVTFTNRAAAELVERMRTRLLSAGRRREAEGLLGARIGTVHAVFGDLLREFAFEAGRSPHVEVMPEALAGRMFMAAADEAISEYAPILEPLAARFGFAAKRKKVDWRDAVRKVAAQARSNGISSECLPDSAERSWQSLSALLPPPHPAGAESLDLDLRDAVNAAVTALRQSADTTKKTAEVLVLLEQAAPALDRRPDDLPWATWVKLTKLEPAKATVPLVAPVIAAASAQARHPRLAADLEAFVRGLFACAAQAGGSYVTWKAERGVIDFTDQEAASLDLLGLPAVRDILRERVGQVLVDEFQDTSPIQLALFLRMASVAEQSVWVGDPKQAIYSFRGTDPELMAAAARDMPRVTGGSTSTLKLSRRSRPSLVRFFDDAFVPAFAALGLPRDQAALGGASRAEYPDQPCAIAVMPLVAPNQAAEAEAVAAGVLAILREPGAWPVVHKEEAATRPLRPGDVAVLCRRNDPCAAIAAALERAGLRAAIGRPGLLRSAEVVIAVAALRWAADGTDTLALAELAHLASGAPAEWLASALAADEGGLEPLVAAAPALRGLRGRLLHLTPAEAVDAAIDAADVVRHAAAMGQVEARLANVEAFRALAREYEQECSTLEMPATVGGLLGWLATSEAERPPNPDADAVQVMTCHDAKGMEWPLVVLADLGEPPEARVFDAEMSEQVSGAEIADPLLGRWIRYWPWPYADQRKSVDLGDAGDMSPEGVAAGLRVSAESVRLLYVAATRARDYLVFAPRVRRGGYSAGWLDRLEGDAGRHLLALPESPGEPVLADGNPHPARFVQAVALEAGVAGQEIAATFLGEAPHGASAPALPLRLRPSGTECAGGPVAFDVVELGPRLPLAGNPDMQRLGEALHTFLAADDPASPIGCRLAQATSCAEAWGVVGAMAPEDYVKAHERLRQWRETRWPDAVEEREVPVTGRKGLQRVSGRIDLLVRSGAGVAIVDHKTFPGGRDAWPARVAEYAPQLATYGDICTTAGETVLARCVHLPVAGVVLELR